MCQIFSYLGWCLPYNNTQGKNKTSNIWWSTVNTVICHSEKCLLSQGWIMALILVTGLFCVIHLIFFFSLFFLLTITEDYRLLLPAVRLGVILHSMHLNQVIQPWPGCSKSLLLIMENVLYSGRCFLLIAAACSCLAGAGDCYKPGKGPEETLLVPKVIFTVHTKKGNN